MTTFPPDSVPLTIAIASASAVSQFLSLSLFLSLSSLSRRKKNFYLSVRPSAFLLSKKVERSYHLVSSIVFNIRS